MQHQNILDNDVKVTIYWTDDAIQYYPIAEEDMKKWQEKYPNFEVVELERESNHGTVIKDAQKYR